MTSLLKAHCSKNLLQKTVRSKSIVKLPPDHVQSEKEHTTKWCTIILPGTWSVLPLSNVQEIQAHLLTCLAHTFKQPMGKITSTCAKLKNAELTCLAARTSKARKTINTGIQVHAGRWSMHESAPAHVYTLPLFVFLFHFSSLQMLVELGKVWQNWDFIVL